MTCRISRLQCWPHTVPPRDHASHGIPPFTFNSVHVAMKSSTLSSMSSRSLHKRVVAQTRCCHDEAAVTRYFGRKRLLSSGKTSELNSDVNYRSGRPAVSGDALRFRSESALWTQQSGLVNSYSASLRKRTYSSSGISRKITTSSLLTKTDDDDRKLVHFQGTTRLSYPQADTEQLAENPKAFELVLKDFAISKPERKGGGHLLLGRNGSGKSLLVDFLTNPDKYGDALSSSSSSHSLADGENHTASSYDVTSVSFDSHKQLLEENPDSSVYRILTEDGFGGTLSKAAQYLVVRFGLFPLLYRRVSTLSTGEIRKCLIIRALCDGGANSKHKGDLTKQKFRSRQNDPKLVILENAFDGLDADSRLELRSIVSKTIRGLDKSGKLLIQQVQASSVRPIQVFMSTHRPEEIMDEISTVSMAIFDDEGNHTRRVVTFERPIGMTREKLLNTALELDEVHASGSADDSKSVHQVDAFPSAEEIRAVWLRDNGSKEDLPDTLLSLDRVQVQRPRDNVDEPSHLREKKMSDSSDNLVTLLHEMTWKIEKGQRWIIAGGNGAGKSTLTRFLLQGSGLGSSRDDNDSILGTYHVDPRTRIGWMSTESHLQMVVGQDENKNESTQTGVWDVLCDGGRIREDIANTFASWIIGDRDRLEQIKILQFNQLSQGEQKLVLLSSTLARRPNLLILDEPTTALDSIARKRVLSLLERICQATNEDLTLILITHYQDEWVPSVSHVLHLDRGNATFQGHKSDYAAKYGIPHV